MKLFVSLVFATALMAQDPAGPQVPKPAGQQEAEAAKPAEQQEAAPSKPDEKAQGAQAEAERWLTGSFDFGYRWVTDVQGDFNTYRSVVNLGEGPKLFGVDLTFQDPSRRLFDRMDLRANSWGGDPYNTARLDARKQGVYNLIVDYRKIAYFNFLPSFADPLKDTRGVFLNERAYDTYRRMADVELELLPGHRIVPFLAFSRNTGQGRGTTVFEVQGDEFPVPNTLNDRSDNYRGGVRFEFNRFHLTLEQGGIKYRDDQQVFTDQLNPGNSLASTAGQQVFLNNLLQSYGVRGDSIYSRGLFTTNPFAWMDIYGQFMYSRPHTDVNYSQFNRGNFVQFAPFQVYNGQFDLLNSTARQPHTSGSFGLELRPFGRIRVLESVMTDRLHNASSAFLAEQLFLGGTPVVDERTIASDRLVTNYHQQELNVLVDAASWLTVRGGHRYVWGDAQVRPNFLNAAQGREIGDLKQQVGLAGLTFRPHTRLNVNFDFEGASADRTYFRTSLHDYRKGGMRARFQVMPSLLLSASIRVLSNENPTPTINYDFLSRFNSVSATWMPAGGKWFSILGEYGRSTVRSDISYIVPSTLDRDRSFYRENAHTGTALLDLGFLGTGTGRPKLSVGGSFFQSSGSRPVRFYQPMSRIAVPFGRHVQWNSEWRWYALSQPFYLYEGFRTHQFITGFRLSM